MSDAGIRAAAAAAARRGWAVFPCLSGGKRPACPGWEWRACADPGLVARYWRPGSNIGIACGPSRLVVVDLDNASHGGQLPGSWQAEPGIKDGADVLAVLAGRAGITAWPGTYTVRTPSGGLHLYFAAIPGREIRNSAGRAGPMVDIRGAGGYVVGPGSVIGGRAYEVTDNQDPQPFPAWIAGLLVPPPESRPVRQIMPGGRDLCGGYGRMRGILDRLAGARPGDGRNALLHWSACRFAEMVAAGEIDAVTAESALYLAAEDNGHVAKHGERATRATIASGMRRGVAA